MQTKTCTKCKETKPVSEFNKNRRTKDGLMGWCKPCTSEEGRRYREANKEKVAESHRRYREANKEKIAETSRRYYEANKERLLELQRKRVEANREQCNRQSSRNQRKYNARSLELAHRQGQPWEDWEEEFVMTDNGLTVYQKAVKLGRSLCSVRGLSLIHI